MTGGSSAYTYDANGNLTSDGVKTYQWNARNELIRVQQGGADVAVFTYDGFGRRVTKTAGSVTHTYLYDGEDIVEERRSTGDVIRYVHGPGIDHVLARTTNGTNPVYYLTDHLGSVVQEVDATQAVILNREYDPWGVPVQGAATSGYAFTGREWDAETGLYYYRARYLDPETSRFLGDDPTGLQDGPNLQTYVQNAPLGSTDPTGRNTFQAALFGVRTGASVGSALGGPVGTVVGAVVGGVVLGLTLTWIESKITDIDGNPDLEGPPGETLRGERRTRRYAEDGLPETDVDTGHHTKEFGEKHSHDWGRSDDGWVTDARSKPRPWKPGDPPPPRNVCKP